MKLPYMQFYPGDWIQDTRCLSSAAKGVWIDVICHLWKCSTRGTDTLPLSGWSKITGSPVEELAVCFDELQRYHVTDCNMEDTRMITLSCRRMVKYSKSVNSTYLRVKKFRVTHRDNAIDNANDYGTEARSQKPEAKKEEGAATADPTLKTRTSKAAKRRPSPPVPPPPAEEVVAGDQNAQGSLRRGDLVGGVPEGAGEGGDCKPSANVPPADLKKTNGGWVAKAVEVWGEHLGVQAYGVMGNLLKPCVKQFGEQPVLDALARYCTSDAAKFGPHPGKFARTIKQFMPASTVRTGTVFVEPDHRW